MSDRKRKSEMADTRHVKQAKTDEVSKPLSKTSSLTESLPKILADVATLRSYLVEMRRHFHQNPELAYQEVKTAAYIANKFREYGLEVHEKVGKTGVVGILRGGAGAGPCIALRADMDALPITELETSSNKDYRSRNTGVMHACGHDAHMSMLVCAARVLSGMASRLRGTVKFLMQPAEEGGAGARAMIEDGALTTIGPKVDQIYGLHVWTHMNVGQVGVKLGALMAGSDRFTIDVAGRGGHGAVPQGTNDAVVAAAHLVSQLHTIVSRNINPLDSAVLSVGTIQGGYASNVIADNVKLSGTTRMFNDITQSVIMERMRALCDGVGKSFGVQCKLDYVKCYPPTVTRSERAMSAVVKAAEKVVGSTAIVTPESTTCAEDMSFFLNAIEDGCFFFLGAAVEPLTAPFCCGRDSALSYCTQSDSVDGSRVRPHHRADFDFDEKVLPVGASIWVQLISDLLLVS